MEKKNIILIGMPGVGKSSAGVVLAKVLGYKFLDSDLVIQEQEGRLLKDIIESEGIDKFIEIENKINAGIKVDKSIIATGGSVVYGEEAMMHFKEMGIVVYLKASYEDIEKRLGDLKGRGVVMRDGQTLEQLYNERAPLYEKYADVIVDETGKDIRQTVSSIAEEILKYLKI